MTAATPFRILAPVAASLSVASSVALAQTAPAEFALPTATAAPTDAAPIIDGRPDEATWSTAPVIAGFVQHEPREGAPVTERTEVRILYDDVALYFGVWLFDRDPLEILTTESRRDVSLDQTDAFLIVLDTYRDGQNAFVFGTTPAGIEYDGQVTNEGEGGQPVRQRQQTGSGGGFNLNWDGSWEVATSSDNRGWYAEFRIPFSTLRYRSGGPQVWGLNLARYIRRRNEQSFWSPIPRQHTIYRISQAGTLDGFEAPTRRSVSLTPYILASGERDYVSSSELDYSGDFGADAKIVPTPSLTLDLTYNTDFAQVEVDEQQVNLTRFNLFFPEKRPFFLENAGLFAVGDPQQAELFFSRRIGISDNAEVPIILGGRLTGKLGGFTVGILDIQTERVGGLVESNNYAVARVMHELPNRSRLGGIVINRVTTSTTGDYNRTYGVDGQLGIGDAITFSGYAASTETPGLAGRDHAYSVTGGYTTRDWRASVTFREVGEDFNPEVGFLARSEYRFFHGRILRHLRTPGISWLREFRPHVSYRGYFDFNGFNETRVVHIDSHVAFENGAFFSPAFNFTREGLKEPFEIATGVIVPPGTYDNLEAAWRFNTNESAPLSLNGGIDIGGFLSGTRRGLSGTVNARRGATMAASLRVEYDNVDLAQGSFETTVISLRLAYTFTPRIYLQSLIQYNSQAGDWSGNVRFGWLSTAGTGFFLVYNEERQTGTESGPLNRVLVAKFSKQLSLVN